MVPDEAENMVEEGRDSKIPPAFFKNSPSLGVSLIKSPIQLTVFLSQSSHLFLISTGTCGEKPFLYLFQLAF